MKSLLDQTPHSTAQREAIAAGLAALVDQDLPRARFSMACGTGKTFTQLKMAEALLEASGRGARRILVLVPSLSLVRQSRDEWASSHSLGADYSSLCVCSDPSLKAGSNGVLQDSGEDHVDLSPEDLAELGVDAATTSAAADVGRINAWLDAREKGPRGSAKAASVIFSTYQSAKVVAMALAARAAGDQAIDVGVFDEAHRTAGAGGKLFSFALADNNIQIRKRLFFTATERVRAAKNEDDDSDSLVTMDDEEVYGPRAYTLSFRQAAERGLTVPVKLIISVVDDEKIARQDLSNRVVQTADGQRLQAREVANLSAVSRAMLEHGIKKVISFHSGVEAAQSFSRLPALALAAGSPGSVSQLSGLKLLHVNGRQSAAHRREQMALYAEATVPSLISNARCLTEGVNVPATDMVAFMDPKRGAIDIVQAIGRAQRKVPGKEVGYVLLPLHVSMRPGESDEQVLDRAARDFQQIRNVLSTIAENDEAFMDALRRSAAANTAAPAGAGADFGDLPIILMSGAQSETLGAEELARAIRTRVLKDALGDSNARWERGFGVLMEFKDTEGHCNVPIHRGSTSTFPLGKWISDQRQAYRKGTLRADRQLRLTELGFEWNPQSKTWETYFGALKEYFDKHGHANVPKQHVTTDGKLPLGTWLESQCRAFRKGGYAPDKQAKMEALGVIWSPNDAQWEANFEAYVKHVRETESHLIPSTSEFQVMRDWVRRQSRSLEEGSLKESRRLRLDGIGFPFNWTSSLILRSAQKQPGGVLRSSKDLDTPDEHQAANSGRTYFEKHLAALVEFRKVHGHLNVPDDYVSPDGLAVGTWAMAQRRLAGLTHYPARFRVALIKIGFPWNPSRPAATVDDRLSRDASRLISEELGDDPLTSFSLSRFESEEQEAASIDRPRGG